MTCTVQQRTGAGLQSACCCYWDKATDGASSPPHTAERRPQSTQKASASRETSAWVPILRRLHLGEMGERPDSGTVHGVRCNDRLAVDRILSSFMLVFNRSFPLWERVYIYISNGGRTTETRHAGKQEVTPPKRGSSLPNYLDQTQTREFG